MRKYVYMSEENITQKFRLKKLFNWKISQNELISKKHKKIDRVLNYIEHLLILISAVSGCVSISAFASLADTFIGIVSSVTGLNICVITTGIKKCKSIIIKKKKKYDKISSLAKFKLNSVEVLISKALIDSNIS